MGFFIVYDLQKFCSKHDTRTTMMTINLLTLGEICNDVPGLAWAWLGLSLGLLPKGVTITIKLEYNFLCRDWPNSVVLYHSAWAMSGCLTLRQWHWDQLSASQKGNIEYHSHYSEIPKKHKFSSSGNFHWCTNII